MWLNNGERVLQVEHRSQIMTDDEVFLSFKIRPEGQSVRDSQFYVHDSVNHVRKDVVKKRLLTSRDIGSKFHAMVYGAMYRYQTEDEKHNDLMLSFFTGSRSNSVGMPEKGDLWFGISRSTQFDDLKGLPDGTPDDSLSDFSFSVGLFETHEAMDQSLSYSKDKDKAGYSYEFYL